MRRKLGEQFPFLQIEFFEESQKMVDFLEAENLQDVAFIALDHDLEMIRGREGEWMDPGTGLDVAKWLANQSAPLCPVVVHTTNSQAASQMMDLLIESKWAAERIVPFGDLEWIDAEWFPAVRKAIVDFASR